MTSYCFVVDADGKPLAPTKEKKGWYMVRTGKAHLVSKMPMVIQLNRSIPQSDIDSNEVRCGIDDGGLHVGVALVEKCKTKNKVLFKGVIEQRNDVKKLMDVRRGYRRYRRYNKRYRKQKVFNRKSSKRKGRIAPSILQKRQATMRVLYRLNGWINITNYWLEDVSIDPEALLKPLNGENGAHGSRLDENLRRAVIARDGRRCMMCGCVGRTLEAHHIKPKRLNGPNTLANLISLCRPCHKKTQGQEERYMPFFFEIVGKPVNVRLNYASHVMVGKSWLRQQISELGILHLTTGSETANKRIDWNIEKSHSNDAICITDLVPDTTHIKEWVIKPMRRQSKAKTDSVLGITHRDLVEYTFRNGETHRGYVTALYPDIEALNFQSPTKHCKKVNAHKCKLLWKYSKIYWLSNAS